MRLFPSELEIGPDEGFSGKDIFGRRDFGVRMTAIARALEGPAVMLLDSPWGSGKSTFVKMWRGDLHQNNIPSIYFDAFANDHHGDAFLALAGEIIARAKDSKGVAKRALSSFKKSAVGVAKVLVRSGLNVGVRLGTAGMMDVALVEQTSKEIIEASKVTSDEISKAFDELLKERLENHNTDRKAFDGFKQALSELANTLTPETTRPGARPPLVFIIDELDRCRPPFALEILETIKHFFAVPNVIFLLVASLKQLEAAVAFAYGSGVDAGTYLEKFYHLRLLLPVPNHLRPQESAEKYLGYLFSQQLAVQEQNYADGLTPMLAGLARNLSLPLRTLERIATYVSLVAISTPPNSFRQPEIVAALCVLKVANPELYRKAREGTLSYEETETFFGITNWLDPQRPGQLAPNAQRVQRWWRFALGVTINDQKEGAWFDQVLEHFNFDQPRRMITVMCEVIDGFRFPTNVQ